APLQEHIQVLKERAEAALQRLADKADGAQAFADVVLDELRTALREVPGAGLLLGPLKDRLQAARRPVPAALRWVSVGGGQLAIGNRPGTRAIPALRAQGPATS